jgi:phosphoserine phosphatase
MAHERLYIVHGIGPDSVGLVGNITQVIAQHKGNIVDLRQDVLHGLFIIYMVVDLADSPLHLDKFTMIILQLGEDTGLELSVRNYSPVARNPEKKNMLVILSGTDHPGIIASISQLLGKYSINIEFADNIGREGIFLMELMTDISSCTIPLENVQNTLRDAMSKMGIKALFQTEDVFNKKKRLILFDICRSMMDSSQRNEIILQAGLDGKQMETLLSSASEYECAKKLEGLPYAAYEAIITSVYTTSETMELIQTLKIMGYSIGLISTASIQFIEQLSKITGIEHFYGIPYEIDNDSQIFTGAISYEYSGINRQSIINRIVTQHAIDSDDITIITAGQSDHLPGIHPLFNLDTILNLFNKHSLSRENLYALLGSFGTGI